jgi:hypothetical protein
MPIQDFALDAHSTQRIQVSWNSDSEPATVRRGVLRSEKGFPTVSNV